MIYIYELSEKQPQLSSIINFIFSQLITHVYLAHNTSKIYFSFAIFIFKKVFLKNSHILRNFLKIQRLGPNGIQANQFSQIQIELIYLLNFLLLFPKKGLKNYKKINKVTKQIINMISGITIGLLFIIFIAYFKNLDESKQHKDVINTKKNYLKKAKNHSIVTQFSFRLNDNEIIWDLGVVCENESIDQGRSYFQENIDISLCFFSRYLSYSGKGGVIYVNGGSYSMNINFSMFYFCICSNHGGAIYFTSTNSSLSMICADSCSCGASYDYHFTCIEASLVNQVEYLSVSNCSHTTSGYRSINVQSGNQRVDNTNSSMNNAIAYSGISISSPSSFTSSHCTFSNNMVSDSICIQLVSASGTISMSYANIVHNNSPSQYGVVYVNGAGSRKMMYCIFHNNQNYLFCVYLGSLEVTHSYIDHSGSFSTSTALSTSNNNSFTNRITYQLQFFNSIHCNADIPLIQSSLEETIKRTNEETLIMTYKRTIDQTIRETAKKTIPRTYAELVCTNQIANWRGIYIIFALVYLVIFLMIS